MQSQLTEVQHNESVNNLPSSSSTSTQHGLRHDLDPSSSPSLQREVGEDSPSPGGDNDTLSISSRGSGSARGRKSKIGRLRSPDRSSQGGSPGSRVELYEKSHYLSAKSDDEVLFKVIPSVNEVEHRVSVDHFPNGESRRVYGVLCITPANWRQR